MKDEHRQIPPPRPLEAAGRTFWDDVNAIGEVRGSVEPLLRLCEQLDERAALRLRVVANAEWRDRVGLRQLDAQIDAALKDLGIRSLLPHRSEPVDDWTTRLARVYKDGDGEIHAWTDEEWAARHPPRTPTDDRR